MSQIANKKTQNANAVLPCNRYSENDFNMDTRYLITITAGLKGGERFTCLLPKATTVFGVRVLGKPSWGNKHREAFSSCGALQAYGE